MKYKIYLSIFALLLLLLPVNIIHAQLARIIGDVYPKDTSSPYGRCVKDTDISYTCHSVSSPPEDPASKPFNSSDLCTVTQSGSTVSCIPLSTTTTTTTTICKTSTGVVIDCGVASKNPACFQPQNKTTAGIQPYAYVNETGCNYKENGTAKAPTTDPTGQTDPRGTGSNTVKPTTNNGGTTTSRTVSTNCDGNNVGPICGIDSPFGKTGLTGFTSIFDLLSTLIKYLLYFSGIIAVVFVILGGYYYVTSSGSEEQKKKGKNTILAALTGLVIIITSFAIVSLITALFNPNK